MCSEKSLVIAFWLDYLRNSLLSVECRRVNALVNVAVKAKIFRTYYTIQSSCCEKCKF